jgi:hypothetical protein
VLIIYIIILFSFLVYVELFNGVHKPAFGCEVYRFHDCIYGADGVVMLQEVLSKFGFGVAMRIVSVVLAKPGGKWGTSLSCVIPLATINHSLHVVHR